MIKLTPIEFQSIVNAASFEIAKYPENYPLAKKKVLEITKWIQSKNWYNPGKEEIMIDELPF